ncbi:nuclease PIN [Rothia sp. ZJ932]|nr:nuclease PIN [Rothia sp. ZJ932]
MAMPTTTIRPTESFARDLVSASVPARGGYSAISIQDYTRISNARGEFLNFLLTPNPAGIPSTDYGVLKAA